jgi:adenosylcobinamide-phosphate synthase
MLTLLAALIWDLTFGELPNTFHPVAWMGHVIGFWRDRALLAMSPASQFLAGLLMTLLIPSLFAATTAVILQLTASIPWLQTVLAIFFLQSSFALKELGAAGQRVAKTLDSNDVSSARYHLRSLLISAAIGSIAENISDSFIAPVIFYACFGVPGAIFYRAINTMDAMIGYRGKYEYLGKFPARVDDVLNFIPARVSALLLLFAGMFCGHSPSRGFSTMLRDRRQTPSPNGGWPMSAMAGLLHIEINKIGCYALGEQGEPLTTKTVSMAWRVALGSALILCAIVFLWIGVVGGSFR